MSVEHMALVFQAGGLDGPEKLLLLAYTNYTDPHGYCWPGEERLAEDTGTSVSTIRRTKKRLIAKNLVKSVRRAETSNLARVNLPLLASLRRSRRVYDDNEMDRLSFDDPSQEGPETRSDLRTVQSDLYPPQAPDLLTVQSDLDHRSDCSEVPVNLTCGPGQPDLQSISDPAVDPPVIHQSLDGRSPSTSGSSGLSAGGSAASGKTKPHFSREERRQYDAFVQALPAPLAALVPKGLPEPLVRAVLAAVDVSSPEGRTVEQLVEYRLLPKWDRYYSRRDEAGPLEKPVGVLVAMLRWDAECGDPRCDERKDVDTGEACRSCEQRQENKRSERAADAVDPIPAPRREPVLITKPRAKCPECHRPLRNSTEDAVCADCREGATA